MKKSLLVAATVTLAGVLTVTLAGCSNKSRNLASLASNWYYDTTFKRIQPTFTEDKAEKLVYKVEQTEKSSNNSYKVEYAEGGTYTTTFYAKEIDADKLEEITLEKWRDDYTAALGAEGKMYLYYYETKLEIPSVTYTFGKNSETFENQGVESCSYFLSVANYLSPVYSKRTVNMAIPANLQASSMNEVYSKVDMVYESFYTLSGSRVSSQITGTYTDNGKEKTVDKTYSIGGFGSYKNSVFDVSYLDITVRAMRNISSSFSQTVGIYTPGMKVGNYVISGGNSPLLSDKEKAAEQLTGIQTVLQGKGLFTPQPIEDSEDMTSLKTRSVRVSYSNGRYSGVSQTYWFAVGEKDNETRTVMVKYREPLTYELGTIEYVLQSIENFSV